MTLLIVVMALVLVRMLWLHYMNDPWTRDARVRANVINIAPDVSGLVDKVLVQDNQLVKKARCYLK
ncbi:biotin/lipoyl-binding protein [Shewanella dokdonensis]|uniref:Biotin/lipoyl-binding protein n=1 Tax=Shewanella dokdonensis TaxID=712036 RepID=A0ABX8DKG3_9GAMM|nr:biotin/lipoyl-binding protein [Shewanella dokdonensis]QVK24471.1 biotin/lipoyl-binding protein [Shewanella dokdonensis]